MHLLLLRHQLYSIPHQKLARIFLQPQPLGCQLSNLSEHIITSLECLVTDFSNLNFVTIFLQPYNYLDINYQIYLKILLVGVSD